MSLNSRNSGCSPPASPVVVDVMATIDPLAPRTWAGVYEIFGAKSRIAARSLLPIHRASKFQARSRSFLGRRRIEPVGARHRWRLARLTAPTARAIGWLAISRARGAEHDGTPILRDHEFPGGALAVCQGAQEVLAAADHPDVGGVRRSGRAHVRLCIRSVHLYAVLRSFCGSSACRRFITTARPR